MSEPVNVKQDLEEFVTLVNQLDSKEKVGRALFLLERMYADLYSLLLTKG